MSAPIPSAGPSNEARLLKWYRAADAAERRAMHSFLVRVSNGWAPGEAEALAWFRSAVARYRARPSAPSSGGVVLPLRQYPA